MKRERSALLLLNRVKVPLPNDRWILVGQPLETFQDTEPNSSHRLFPYDKINMWMWGPSLYSVSSFFSKGWQIVRLLRLYQRESVCGSFTFFPSKTPWIAFIFIPARWWREQGCPLFGLFLSLFYGPHKLLSPIQREMKCGDKRVKILWTNIYWNPIVQVSIGGGPIYSLSWVPLYY